MRRAVTSLSVALLLSSCLPISKHTVNRDSQLKIYEHQEETGERTLLAKTTSTSVALEVTLESQATCHTDQRRVVRRFSKLQKTTNPWVHGALYIVGLGGLGLAGYILYDNLSVDDPANRKFPIGTSLEQGRNVGIGISAAASLLLMIALGSSAAAVDEMSSPVTLELPVEGSKKVVDCKVKPAGGEFVGLVFSTGGVARIYVPVGKTDAAGHVAVSWATVQAQLPPSVRPEANLVAGAPEKIGIALTQNGPIDALTTIVLPAGADPESAWAAAQTADTEEAYRVFLERFPDSTHAPEAITKGKTAGLRGAQVAFDKAIAAEQLEAATEALGKLRASADAATIAAAQEKLDRTRKTVRGRDAQTKYPQLVAAIETAADPATALADARAALDALREATPDQSARLEEQLTSAQKRATERYVREGREAALKRDFTLSDKKFAIASTVAVSPADVEKQRLAAIKDAVKAGQAEARQLAKAKNYDGAIAIADALLAVSPSTKSLATDRTKWQQAMDRARKLAEQRVAAEAAAQRKREEREAAAQAAKDKAAADAMAREARIAEARAKKEQEEAERQAKKAQAEADRKAREEAARMAADQKKRQLEEHRAAEKAAQAAKLEEQRRQAELAKQKKEEERRQAAAAKLDAQLQKKAAANMPYTVQFALPPRFSTDDVLKRLPVPKSCTATIKRFFAKPTTCPTCAPRAMSRVEMTCGTLVFSFLNDQRDVWLTCSGDKQTCKDCLSAGSSALSPFIDAKEKLQTVQGCKK
jgi:hypothetical protein